VRGGNVDDAAECARLHLGQREADRVEGGGKVDRENRIPFGQREFIDRGDVLDARVVDEHVDAAEFGERRSHHRLDRFRLAHVGAVVARFDAELAFEGGAQLLDFRSVAETVEDDIGAFARKGARDAQSDAARGARDQCRLVLELHCGFLVI